MLNEFTAKKLGEVLAFSRVGKETFERSRSAMTRVFGSDETERIIEDNNALAARIELIAEESETTNTVEKKAEATGEKLKKMRDLYVGDQWDNETELMEWSGFFEGAAIVHFSLVLGTAEKLEHATIKHIATDGMALHRKIFSVAETILRDTGKNRA